MSPAPLTLQRKLAWIGVLYFAQGFPFGLVIKAWPVYFRQHGVSLAEIGLMSLLSLPYTLKAAWAPLVDRFAHRQTWVAAALIVMAALSLALPAAPTAGPFLWTVLLAFTLASATQDIAIDGYAVDVAGSDERGPINSVRVAMYRIGMVASAGLALVMAEALGWQASWVGCAAVSLALAGAALASPRAPRQAPHPPPAESRRARPYRFGLLAATLALLALAAATAWSPLTLAGAAIAATLAVASFLDPAMLAWARRREMVAPLVFILLYRIPDSTLSRMVEPFWVDRGLAPSEIAAVATTLGTVLIIAGAAMGGWFVRRRGVLPALLWFGLAGGLSNLAYALVALADLPRAALYAASMIESFSYGLATAAFLSLLMGLCDREHAATQFALLTAAFALSRDLFGALSGLGAEALGYGAYFTLTALLALPSLAMLPLLRGRVENGAVPARLTEEVVAS